MGVVLPMRAPNYVHDQVMITVKQNHDDDSMMLHEENLQGPNVRRFHEKNRQNGNTVWKIRDFSVTHILREINFGHSRSAKFAI